MTRTSLRPIPTNADEDLVAYARSLLASGMSLREVAASLAIPVEYLATQAVIPLIEESFKE
jgi:hypothetical protein